MHYSEVDETATGSANSWFEAPWATGFFSALAACAEAVDAFGVDLDDHALFAGSEVGILVLAEVFLGEHVDVFDGALFGDRGRAADHHVAGLLVLGGEDGDGCSGVALDVGDFGSATGAVDEDVLAVVVDPDRGGLG